MKISFNFKRGGDAYGRLRPFLAKVLANVGSIGSEVVAHVQKSQKKGGMKKWATVSKA